MGEARRRKLAGEPPKGPKREKPSNSEEKRLISSMIGDDPMAIAIALMMGARRRGGSVTIK